MQNFLIPYLEVTKVYNICFSLISCHWKIWHLRTLKCFYHYLQYGLMILENDLLRKEFDEPNKKLQQA